MARIIELQHQLSLKSNKKDIGKTYEVLVESLSKRSDKHLAGRNDQNKWVIFPKEDHSPGEYVNVKIDDCTPATLFGNIVD